MTPEQKAKELYDKFKMHSEMHKTTALSYPYFDYDIQKNNVKQCAIICVNEVLLDKMILGGGYKFHEIESAKYWEKVKEEILKL